MRRLAPAPASELPQGCSQGSFLQGLLSHPLALTLASMSNNPGPVAVALPMPASSRPLAHLPAAWAQAMPHSAPALATRTPVLANAVRAP